MIAFDLQAMQSVGNSERGIARYVTEVLRALLAGPHADVVDVFLWNDRVPYSSRIDELGIDDRLRSFSEMRGLDVDVLHVNSPFEVPDVGDLMPPVRAHRIVVTCYDLIPLLFPERYLADRRINAIYRSRLGLIAAADAVVTDSQSAADDVAEHLGVSPRRVTVIGGGVSDQFVPPTTPLAERIAALRTAVPDIGPRYILVPTAADWRKNSIGAIEAFADLPSELRERHQLVLFCRLTHEQRAKLIAVARRNRVEDRVIITGFVPDDLLVSLYQSAELVFFPTFYEGFGLPVVEARHCGARVICSGTSSLPEVLVDERARFNPFEPDEMTEALRVALTDPDRAVLLDQLPDAGFTWAAAADRLAGVYRDLASSVRRPLVSTGVADVRRVGVVGAFPPELDPCAHDNLALLQALVARDDVDVSAFTPGDAPGYVFDLPCPVEHIAALPALWSDRRLDAVVYLVGDETHRSVTGMVRHVPGHLVVHGVVPWSVTDRALSILARDPEEGADRRHHAAPDVAVLDWADGGAADAAADQLVDAITCGAITCRTAPAAASST